MKRSRKAGAEESQGRDAALRQTRFAATIHPGRRAKTKEWAEDLGVDRVPDVKGRVRALLTVEDLVRLLDQGLEVRLYRAYTDAPLDPALIMTDSSFQDWLEEQANTFKANPGPKPFLEP